MVFEIDNARRKEGDKSFNELLARAKQLATTSGEELDILTQWILHDLGYKKKSTKKDQRSTTTSVNNEKIVENQPCKAKNKTQAISTVQCREKKRKIVIILNGVIKKASHDNFSTKNDEQIRHESSPREVQDEYFNTHNENFPHDAFGWMKRNRATIEDHERHHNTKNKMKKVKITQEVPRDVPPPQLPMIFINIIESMNGSQPQLVIDKEIKQTDVSYHHDRLNLPKNQVRSMNFLNEKELKELEPLDGKKGGGVQVRVIQPCLEETTLQLRRWATSSGYGYVLNSGWKNVFEEKRNNIAVGKRIQVWSFRVNNPDHVWFALVC